MSNISLKYRIALVFSILSAITIVIVMWQTEKSSFADIEKLMGLRQQTILRLLCEPSRFALINEEYGDLQPYLQNVIDTPGVSTIFLADHRNRVVASSDSALLNKPLPAMQDTWETVWVARELSNQAGYQGLLAIQFSRALLLEAFRKARFRGFAIASAAIAFIALAALLMGHLLVRRINILNQAACKIADGDLHVEVDIPGSDEIAMLADAFIEMTRKLESTMENLRIQEQSLRESEERFRAISSNTPDHILMQDGELRYSWVINPQLGLTEQAMIGKTDYDFLKKEDADKLTTIKSRVLETGQPVHLETSLISLSGETEYFDGTYVPRFDTRGLVAGLIGYLRNVTERKLMEEELRKYREHLEELVEERSRQIAERNRQLEHANIRLQELDRLKSIFLASMSHELRTPLNSIIGFTGIILQGLSGKINGEQQDQLQRVYRAGKHLLSLINDVIDISKIEAGRVDIDVKEFDLDAVIEEAVSILGLEVKDKGLDLEVIYPERLILKTDRRRLLQVILNYLNNAVKFTDKGKIRIEARETRDEIGMRNAECGMRNEDEEGTTIVISVSDTGMGIREEDLPKLFRSFVRLDSSVKGAVPGTGLGLYLTKKIVTELLGGEVSAKSTYGEGSVFTLEIPKELNA